MRVFVAGATGALGAVLVPRLVAAGHAVTGLTRSEERARRLEAQGASAVVADARDVGRLREVVLAAEPEAVLDELTDLPKDVKPLGLRHMYDRQTPLKRAASAALLSAAEEAGARLHLMQSVAFLYPPAGHPAAGPGLATEDEPVWPDPPAPWDDGLAVFDERERAVVGSSALTGVVLRYGFFYGPGTHYAADGSLTQLIRRRSYPIVGAGTGVCSFIHVEDAADATVAALDAGVRGTFNIVDDSPVAASVWLPDFARRLGAKPPRRVPATLARLTAGPLAVHFSTTLRGASNARARHELGWSPRFPSYAEGLAATPAI